jgi:hypothetical protein
MYAFLGFFYVFITVYIYKILKTDKSTIKIYVDTVIVDGDNKYDSQGDYIMGESEIESEIESESES